MIVRKALGNATGQDVGESIRKNFVAAMRNGDKLCLDMADKIPAFAEYASDGTFDPALFFNFAEFKKEASHIPFVREDENHGVGGVNPGFGYARSNDFSCSVRTSVENEEQLQNVINGIPGFNEHFHHVIFE